MFRTFIAGCWIILLVLFLTGCGRTGKKAPPIMEVKGTIEMDNKPMSSGDIFFVNPGAPPLILKITNGKFSGRIAIEPGEKKVEIYAYKEGKPLPTATTNDPVMENYIPAQYNTFSQLKADLKKEGPNEFSFKITSQ